MDAFFAAVRVDPAGRVVGVDFTPEQLAKGRRLAGGGGFDQVESREGRIEQLSVDAGSAGRVVSNGVINLSPDKRQVFADAARVLRRGGRLALADIVSERHLKSSIVCDADLWPTCIGGAAQQHAYRDAIEAAGRRISHVRGNPYEFISERARAASAKYGVNSVSLPARKA